VSWKEGTVRVLYKVGLKEKEASDFKAYRFPLDRWRI
jgi:hypothetical protein